MTARPPGAELVAAVSRLAFLLEVWECRPPAGEPAPTARRAGAEAVTAVDDLIRTLHRTRASLVAELRARDDETGRQVDALLAARSAQGRTAPAESRAEARSGPSEGEDTRPVRDTAPMGDA